jgi:predicted GIY-YIG superfamily endonuclease
MHNERAVAQARERQLKRWTRAKKEALIAGDLVLLKRL